MSVTKPLSSAIENIFNTVFEAVNEISKDGSLAVKDLAIEVSLEMEQRTNSNKELLSNISGINNSFSNRMLQRQNASYSHFKIGFRPKTN